MPVDFFLRSPSTDLLRSREEALVLSWAFVERETTEEVPLSLQALVAITGLSNSTSVM